MDKEYIAIPTHADIQQLALHDPLIYTALALQHDWGNITNEEIYRIIIKQVVERQQQTQTSYERFMSRCTCRPML